MLMISTNRVGQRSPQYENAIDAAAGAGVKHVIYTSFVGRDGCVSLALRDHRFAEQKLRASGMASTFLRNSQYAEAMRDAGAPAAIGSGVWRSSSAGGRIAMISREDCIRAAIPVMTGDGHENRIYNITGPDRISYREIAELVAELSGRPIEFLDVTDEDMYAFFDSLGVPRSAKDDHVVNGFGWCSDDMVSFEATIRDGDFDVISDDVETLTGEKPISFRDFMTRYQDRFRAMAAENSKTV